MSSYIFFENASPFTFTLVNDSNQQFSIVQPNGLYSLKLPYSDNAATRYTMKFSGHKFQFWLDSSGRVSQISPTDIIYVKILKEEHHPNVDPWPHVTPSRGDLQAHHYLHGPNHNKFLITAINNIYARVRPTLNAFVDDRVLRKDFST